jgi:hypothetical protein
MTGEIDIKEDKGESGPGGLLIIKVEQGFGFQLLPGI